MRAWLGLIAVLSLVGGASEAGEVCPEANPDGRNRVLIETPVGDICLDLLDRPGEAPNTVANFMTYASAGDYAEMFFHRSVDGGIWIIQGGGFSWTEEDGYQRIPPDPPVANEFGASNTRGTVSMAKFAGNPHSATNQFFINLRDNSAVLDAQNGGFTVFARVVDEDLEVAEEIGGLHTESGQYAVDSPLNQNFTNLPVLSLLPRDPAGYGCIRFCPDPEPDGTALWQDIRTDECTDNVFFSGCVGAEQLDEAIDMTIAALDPTVPERLVMARIVPEPGAPLLALVGAVVLFGVRSRIGPRA
jgi:cyclophilin family peptidyl-prolyl cis-trans isomerase